eukprot:UN33522
MKSIQLFCSYDDIKSSCLPYLDEKSCNLTLKKRVTIAEKYVVPKAAQLCSYGSYSFQYIDYLNGIFQIIIEYLDTIKQVLIFRQRVVPEGGKETADCESCDCRFEKKTLI